MFSLNTALTKATQMLKERAYLHHYEKYGVNQEVFEETFMMCEETLAQYADLKRIISKFNNQNIRRIRPGYGLEPKYYEKLLGKRTPFKLVKGEPLKKSLLKKLNIK